MKRLPWRSLLCTLALFCVALSPAQTQVLTFNYNGPFVAPSGNQVTGTYAPLTGFTTAGGKSYVMTANPFQVAFQDDPSATFLNILTNQPSSIVANGNPLTFGALYDFTTAGKNLNNGDLVVWSYAEHVAGATNRFGQNFFIQNKGGAISGAKVHWIQTVVNNWKSLTVPGTPDSRVDTPSTTTPYYDKGADATSVYLFDDPARDNGNLLDGYNDAKPIFFNFETFLVNENSTYTLNGDNTVKTKGSIDLYDGVRWGFILGTPEPGVTTLLSVSITLLPGLLILRVRSKRRTARRNTTH
jgi:hypothetical protein